MAETEEIVDCAFLDIEAVLWQRAQCPDFGGKRQTTILLREVQRFDPKRIASERQRASHATGARRRRERRSGEPAERRERRSGERATL